MCLFSTKQNCTVLGLGLDPLLQPYTIIKDHVKYAVDSDFARLHSLTTINQARTSFVCSLKGGVLFASSYKQAVESNDQLIRLTGDLSG